MRVGIAAIKGTYSGSVQIADKEPPIRYKLIVEGGGTPGRMKGEGVITLSTRDDSTTEVSYQGDVQVIGPLAGIGQRLLGAAARMLIDQFFKCMEQSVTSN
jgi:carbon monoxide dehydrogenase subunit G